MGGILKISVFLILIEFSGLKLKRLVHREDWNLNIQTFTLRTPDLKTPINFEDSAVNNIFIYTVWNEIKHKFVSAPK